MKRTRLGSAEIMYVKEISLLKLVFSKSKSICVDLFCMMGRVLVKEQPIDVLG